MSEEPANKNTEAQRRLFSTKKKTKSSNSRLSKSITAERMNFVKNMKDPNLLIESVNTHLDHIYRTDPVNYLTYDLLCNHVSGLGNTSFNFVKTFFFKHDSLISVICYTFINF